MKHEDAIFDRDRMLFTHWSDGLCMTWSTSNGNLDNIDITGVEGEEIHAQILSSDFQQIGAWTQDRDDTFIVKVLF